MTFLKNLTLSICVLSVVYLIVSMLSPDRYKRQIRAVLSLICAVTVAGVILGSADEDFDTGIDINGSQSLSGSQEYATNLILSELESKLDEQIGNMMLQSGVPVQKISVKTNIDDEGSIFISEISMTVDGSKDEYEQKIKGITSEKIGEVSMNLTFSEDNNGA